MTLLASEEEGRAFTAARCAPGDFALVEQFTAALIEELPRQNLISRGSVAHIWLRHIADSAQLLDHVPRETGVWLDLGSGAGLPGLVLAIMQPERRFILVESRNLRIQWLTKIITDLKLANCEVRGDDLRKTTAIEAAVISARAFAPLDRLIAQSARFSTTATRWVLPKGRSAAQEVEMLPPKLRAMFHVKQSVTDAEAGIVLGAGKVEAST